MCNLIAPEGIEWELLVVNNNCTDNTDEIIASFSEKLPIRRLCEERPGLSNARNAAIRVATGDVVLFTDDDILADPNWLVSYAGAERRWPDAAYFGGPIEPWYETPPPTWISNNLGVLTGMLGIRDFGAIEGPLLDDKQPFGANMGFRRHIFTDVEFNPRLGVVGGTWAGGEETTLFEQLRNKGCVGIGVPTARVRHFVPVRNMSRDHIWNWAHGWGRSVVRMRRMRGESPTSLPQWRLRVDCVRHYGRYVQNRLLNRDDWVHSLYNVACLRGMISELQSA